VENLKKKIIAFILVSLISVSLVGCGSNKTSNETNTASTKTVESDTSKTDSQKVDMPKDLQPTGKGNILISTPSGTSENNNIPVIYVSKDTSVMQIGLDTKEFDGGKLSYVLTDQIVNNKTQLGNSQITLTLKGDSLKVGIHKIEVVQYDNDETTGKIVTYKTASYEVKSK